MINKHKLIRVDKKHVRECIFKSGVWNGIVNYSGKLVYATFTCIASLHNPELLEFYMSS